MRNSDQPQNIEKLSRDAAVQIGEEVKDVNNQGVVSRETEPEEKPKGELIRLGLRAFIKKEKPELSEQSIDNQAYGMLSALCGMLTDQDKYQRDYAKKKIRLMVKLGKEAGK